MKLTNNFTLEELCASDTASRRGIDNTPTPEAMTQLEKLAKMILQPIRDKFGKAIHVNSGYRGPKLNAAVGGSKTSQHMKGQAADLRPNDLNIPKKELFDCIKDMMDKGEIVVGQLIWEYGTKREPQWVHVSLPNANNRNKVLYLGVK